VKGQPGPLPDREIEAIQRFVASRFDYDPPPFLAEGVEVEVVRCRTPLAMCSPPVPTFARAI